MNDAAYMKKALNLAIKGKGRVSPNPMVGCVIARNGKIISEGWHKRFGFDHAEIDALKKINFKAKGASLYVNLEPCFHLGKTPPCVEAIISSGVKEVVIAGKDPNPLTNGKSINKLRRAGVKVRAGVLRSEAESLNEDFIKYIKKKLPFVTAKCAQTLDGKIATRKHESKWITSEKTRAYTRHLRCNYDAILVGVNTVLKDDPKLDTGSQKGIKKVIVDSSLKSSLKAKLFSKINLSDRIVATTKKASLKKIKLFKEKGVDVIVCPEKGKKVDLKWLFKRLAEKGIMSLLIEGGGQIIGAALKAGLVDKMIIYIAPKIIGDQEALSSVSGVNIKNIDKAIKLSKLTINTINKDIEVTGYVLRNS